MNANNGGNTRIEGMSTTEDTSNSSMQHNSMNAKKGRDASHCRDATTEGSQQQWLHQEQKGF
jgi:hypothetical protein